MLSNSTILFFVIYTCNFRVPRSVFRFLDFFFFGNEGGKINQIFDTKTLTRDRLKGFSYVLLLFFDIMMSGFFKEVIYQVNELIIGKFLGFFGVDF